MASPHINSFYRIWFTWIDPLIVSGTVLGCILAPEAILEAFIPPSIWRLQSHQVFLVHHIASLYAFLGIMFVVLLRACPDPKVWRIVQAATLMVDIAILASSYDALKRQGRLEMQTWRGADWFSLLMTIWVAVIRAAYLMEIGGGVGMVHKKKA